MGELPPLKMTSVYVCGVGNCIPHVCASTQSQERILDPITHVCAGTQHQERTLDPLKCLLWVLRTARVLDAREALSLVCRVPLQPLLPPQMSSLTQAHQKALASLTSKAEDLEKSLSSLEMKRAGETKQLAVAQKEVELLRSQLRSGAGATGKGLAGDGMGASGLLH